MNRDPSIERELVRSVSTLDIDTIDPLVEKLQALGYSNFDIVPLMNEGVANVGVHFEHGDYFLADMILAGKVYSDVLKHLEQTADAKPISPIGTVVIGVMENDIHDIGKDIIVGLLRLEGFNVIDLGVDVDANRFLNAALQYRPNVIALCGMLYHSSIMMKKTIQLLEKGNVRSFARIIIGGGCASKTVCEQVHADAFFTEPEDTLAYCKAQAASS